MSVLARSVIESVAHALSGEYGVEVVFRGNDCCTNGRIIYLPALPDDVPATLVETLRGFLDHEVGHIIFTDFSLVKGEIKDQVEKLAFNAVEDVRIEIAMEKIWKGCAVNFEKLDSRVDTKLEENWEEMDPIVKIFVLFIKIGRRGWDCPFVEKNVGEYLPILDAIAEEFDEIKNLKDSKDALAMARRILDLIEKAVAPPPPPVSRDAGRSDETEDREITEVVIKEGKTGPDKTTGKKMKFAPEVKVRVEKASKEEEKDETVPEDKEKDKEASEDKTSPEAKAVSEDEATPEDEKEGEEPLESGTTDDGEPDEESDEESESGSGPESLPDIPDELKEKIKAALEKETGKEMLTAGTVISEEAAVLGGYRVFSTEKDTFKPPKTSPADLETYEAVRKEIGGFVGVLKSQLQRILVSQKRSRWEGGKKQGFINPSALVHIVNKTSDRVYRIRKEGAKLNTAVSILVDLSGSMGYSKTAVARDTAILMAETLNQINVPFEILGFTGDYNECSEKGKTRYSRWGSLDMICFKTFDEPLGADQRKRLGAMLSVQQCQNYDGESVLLAAKRLLLRPDRKKVLFVLSDGEPAAAHCHLRELDPHLHQVVQELESIPDFFVCGFGILTDAPKHYYKNHVLIRDVAQLPKVLIENLYRALVLN